MRGSISFSSITIAKRVRRYLKLHYSSDQGRNFREATKAMAVVAPQFGLVPLQKMACPEAIVALMPQLGELKSIYFTLLD